MEKEKVLSQQKKIALREKNIDVYNATLNVDKIGSDENRNLRTWRKEILAIEQSFFLHPKV